MTDAITDSLAIATDLIAVRHDGADAKALLKRCAIWLFNREQEEWTIRDSRCRVSQKLDMLDKATDRVRAVRLNCIEIIRQVERVAA
jgi:hypothetical protein